MKIPQSELIELKTDIHEIVKHLYKMKEPGLSLGASQKKDNSLVTDIDIAISNLFENFCAKKKLGLISEENAHRSTTYPVAVLDPIDGTRELVEGLGECCVSFCIYYGTIEDSRNFSWIYNPFTGFELTSTQLFLKSAKTRSDRLLGLVSNSEFDQDLYQNINLSELNLLSPRGSIAFKLGLLASGACDFVVSLKGKNIWDIAAGTHLCSQRDIHLYYNGQRLTSLDDFRIESGVLLWCPEKYKDSLFSSFLK